MGSAAVCAALSRLPSEIPSLLGLPGNILNVFWEQLLFEITKDPYFTLGDATAVLTFIFYFILFLVILGLFEIIRAAPANQSKV